MTDNGPLTWWGNSATGSETVRGTVSDFSDVPTAKRENTVTQWNKKVKSKPKTKNQSLIIHIHISLYTGSKYCTPRPYTWAFNAIMDTYQNTLCLLQKRQNAVIWIERVHSSLKRHRNINRVPVIYKGCEGMQREEPKRTCFQRTSIWKREW